MLLLRTLETSGLKALKLALEGYRTNQVHSPDISRQFGQIIKALLDLQQIPEPYEVLLEINEELERRIKHTTVRIVDPGRASRLSSLSQHEKVILVLIGKGFDNPRMADKLGISYRTVANHKANIAAKLGLGSAKDLVSFAVEHFDILTNTSL